MVTVKAKATFDAPLDAVAQEQVKDSYCDAVSEEINIVVDQLLCNISETTTRRRLLAAVSYDLSATTETTPEEASAIESNADLQTAVETTFTADADVVAANGGSAPTVEVEPPVVETVADTTTKSLQETTTDEFEFTEAPNNSAVSISCGLLMLVSLFTL